MICIINKCVYFPANEDSEGRGSPPKIHDLELALSARDSEITRLMDQLKVAEAEVARLDEREGDAVYSVLEAWDWCSDERLAMVYASIRKMVFEEIEDLEEVFKIPPEEASEATEQAEDKPHCEMVNISTRSFLK